MLEFEDTMIKAKDGIASKQFALASMYFSGEVIPNSLCHAYIWATFANLNRYEGASNFLSIIFDELLKNGVAQSEIMRYREKAADMLEKNPALLRLQNAPA